MATKEQIQSFWERDRNSARGKYYVDDQCTDCDLCRETAPSVFKRNDEEGTSYVFRQPVTEEEVRQVEEAVGGCATEAIRTDGLEFDWDRNVPLNSGPMPDEEPMIRDEVDGGDIASEKPKKSCCQKKVQPWWRFWG